MYVLKSKWLTHLHYSNVNKWDTRHTLDNHGTEKISFTLSYQVVYLIHDPALTWDWHNAQNWRQQASWKPALEDLLAPPDWGEFGCWPAEAGPGHPLASQRGRSPQGSPRRPRGQWGTRRGQGVQLHIHWYCCQLQSFDSLGYFQDKQISI